MTDPKVYALLAANSYWDIRSFGTQFNNQAPIPEGWKVLEQYDESGSGENASIGYGGFSARVFKNTKFDHLPI